MRNFVLLYTILVIIVFLPTKAAARNFPEPARLSQKIQQDMQTIRLVYLMPSDGTYRPEYETAITNAAKHLQMWYKSQMGNNKTFVLNSPTVEVYQTEHASNWYNTNPSHQDQKYWFTFNVINDGFALTNGRFYDPNYIYVYYMDVENDPNQYGGSGAGGVAVLAQHDLRGLVGEDTRFPSECRWVGGLGHELGHALGLGHPPECETNPNSPSCQSIMFFGLYNYPNTFFVSVDKNFLSQSSFIRSQDLNTAIFSCESLLTLDYPIYMPYMSAN